MKFRTQNKSLNIITLNIPYPADYGGMIDTFYRIKSFHDLGVHVHLHCFQYGRPSQEELESICETVTYYSRKSGLLSLFTEKPFIVSSRRSALLLKNLCKNDFPILFDGLHSTYYINHLSLSDRRKVVRMHNIEHEYYRSLSIREHNRVKKMYFLLESIRLEHYEKVLENVDHILTISNSDQEYFSTKYQNASLISPSHPFSESESMPGFGEYILYHGDLSVNENAAIADFLISEVFSKVSFRCIIAGKNAPPFLRTHASYYSNIQIISNPDNAEMMNLIRRAHINIIMAMSPDGFKIKLLFALYAGRHCIVNDMITKGNYLGELCHVSDSGKKMADKIHILMNLPFTAEMILKRNEVLSEHYNNIKTANNILNMIF